MALKYNRFMLPVPPPFAKWQSELQGSSEEHYQIFNGLWKEVELANLAGSTQWIKDVQAVLYKYFDSLLYIFVHKAAPTKNPYTVSIDREMFWGFVKRCKLTSPYLSLSMIDVMLTCIGINSKKLIGKPMHEPHYQVKLGQFLEIIVRISLLRQKDWQKAAVPLPDCLSELVEDHVLHYEKVNEKAGDDDKSRLRFDDTRLGVDADGRVLEQDEWMLEYHVRKMLEINRTKLRAIFRKWAQADGLKETLSVHELLLLLEPSGLLGPDLTRAQLLEAVGMTLLGADNTHLAEWMEVTTKDPESQVMIFPEFCDSLARAAFTKYRDDLHSQPELKTHEFCQLLISGPASKAEPPPRPQPEPEEPPPPPPEPEKKKKK